MKAFLSFTLLVFIFITLGCNKLHENKKGQLLAKVGDFELFLEDIPAEKFTSTLEGDSATRLRHYVEKWVEDQFFLLKAKEVVSDDEGVREIIEEYKRNLMIYELEKKWMDSYSDTIITDSLIETYYENNKDNFQLKKNIVKIRYVKTDVDVSKKELTKVRAWLKNTNDENDSLLKVFAEKNADNFYLLNNWLYFDDVLREIPISPNYNQERFLQNNRFVELSEGEFIYLINFVDFKTKDDITPLEFEIENIKKYIVMQRKAKYIENKRRQLLENAYNLGEIKIWQN